MNKRIAVVLTATVLTAGLLFAQAKNSRQATEAVAPSYPPLAVRARIQGTISVLVEIDEVGRILSMAAPGGHPIFIPPSLDAAKQWKFERGNGNTAVTLTFVFVLVGADEPAKTIFKPPYTVEVHAKAPPIRTIYNELQSK
jgi:outer membrane biosynthesis protein TonB